MPRGLPPPNSVEHTEAVVDAALPVLKASGGRAFLLFTTLRALNAARERLAAAFEREGLDFPRARAGRRLEDRAAAALSRARQRGAARQRELLGRRRRARATRCRSSSSTSCRSRRPTIRCSPRGSRELAAEGGNAFMDWQLPQAAISLKQGAGRLIRTETDRGVLMLCDPRLSTSPTAGGSGRACRR